MTVLENH